MLPASLTKRIVLDRKTHSRNLKLLDRVRWVSVYRRNAIPAVRTLAAFSKEALESEFECRVCHVKCLTEANLDRHRLHCRREGFKRKVDISISEFNTTDRLKRPERVLENCVTHSTSPENAQSIKRASMLLGSKDSQSVYDGNLSMPDAPGSVYFKVAPESDGLVYPFTRYPKGLPPGSPCSIAVVPLSFLDQDDYDLYHCTTIPTQFGPSRFHQVHTTLVAASRSERAFCEQYLVRLDKEKNRFLWKDHLGWNVSTRFRYYRDDDYERPHTLILVVAGSLALPPDAKFIDAKILESVGFEFRCPVPECTAKPCTSFQLKNHYRAYHARVRFPCREEGCSKTFSDYGTARVHRLTVHGERRYKCTEPGCPAKFENTYFRDQHWQLAHQEVVKCTFEGCDKTFRRQASMFRHLRRSHVERIPCELDCGKSFTQRSDMLRHFASEHMNQSLKCSVEGCDRTFSSNITLQRHVASAHNGSRFSCTFPACGKSFTQKSTMRLHIESEHAMTRIPCTHEGCDQTFSYRANMVAHLSKAHASDCKQMASQ